MIISALSQLIQNTDTVYTFFIHFILYLCMQPEANHIKQLLYLLSHGIASLFISIQGCFLTVCMCEGHFYIKTIMHHEKEIIRKTFQLMRIMHKNKNHERLRRDSICVGLHFIFTYMLILESQSEPLQQQQVQWETETIQRQPERIARLQTVSCFAHLSQTL